jgi:hypothetical protein
MWRRGGQDLLQRTGVVPPQLLSVYAAARIGITGRCGAALYHEAGVLALGSLACGLLTLAFARSQVTRLLSLAAHLHALALLTLQQLHLLNRGVACTAVAYAWCIGTQSFFVDRICFACMAV